MRIELEPAFVLHRRPYSNSSWIVELFTPNHGRVAALARSARGPRSRYKGSLELFSPLLISWYGRRELKTLGNIELRSAPYFLSANSLSCGFYLNELLLRLLHREDPHNNLFYAYEKTLRTIMEPHSQEVGLRYFEKQLLQELGYGLPWVDGEGDYRYLPDRGFVLSEYSVNNPIVFSGSMLMAFQQEKLAEKEHLQQAKQLMRLVLSQHLGEKPLKSRELLR